MLQNNTFVIFIGVARVQNWGQGLGFGATARVSQRGQGQSDHACGVPRSWNILVISNLCLQLIVHSPTCYQTSGTLKILSKTVVTIWILYDIVVCHPGVWIACWLPVEPLDVFPAPTHGHIMYIRVGLLYEAQKIILWTVVQKPGFRRFNKREFPRAPSRASQKYRHLEMQKTSKFLVAGALP